MHFTDFFVRGLFVSYTGCFLVHEPFETLGKLPVIAWGNTFFSCSPSNSIAIPKSYSYSNLECPILLSGHVLHLFTLGWISKARINKRTTRSLIKGESDNFKNNKCFTLVSLQSHSKFKRQIIIIFSPCACKNWNKKMIHPQCY